jgi:hypothetical protein
MGFFAGSFFHCPFWILEIDDLWGAVRIRYLCTLSASTLKVAGAAAFCNKKIQDGAEVVAVQGDAKNCFSKNGNETLTSCGGTAPV